MAEPILQLFRLFVLLVLAGGTVFLVWQGWRLLASTSSVLWVLLYAIFIGFCLFTGSAMASLHYLQSYPAVQAATETPKIPGNPTSVLLRDRPEYMKVCAYAQIGRAEVYWKCATKMMSIPEDVRLLELRNPD